MKEKVDDLTVSNFSYDPDQPPEGTPISTPWKGHFMRSEWTTTLFTQYLWPVLFYSHEATTMRQIQHQSLLHAQPWKPWSEELDDRSGSIIITTDKMFLQNLSIVPWDQLPAFTLQQRPSGILDKFHGWSLRLEHQNEDSHCP